MEKKAFEISQIKNENDLNALCLALNDIEQVSHIKVGKSDIVFYCLNIDALLNTIQSIDKDVVVKEVIDGKKRQYDFASKKEIKYYFMVRNILNEGDIEKFVEQLQSHAQYKNVEYDRYNKMLMLVSSRKNVYQDISKILYRINPSTELIEYRKPIRSEDVFNQKYLKTYIRISLLLLSIALAIITSKDETIMTPIFWLITALILGENIVINAFKNLKHLQFFKTDVLFVIGLVMGIVSGAYIETCVAIIVYQLTHRILAPVLEKAISRIDETVIIPEKGTKSSGQTLEVVSLYDFEVGDIMVVHSGETIHIPGIIHKGTSQLNTYTNTGSYDDVQVKKGDEVHSGDINVGEKDIYIKINARYESSNYVHLMDIASKAPTYESKVEKYVKKIAKLYTPMMFVVSIVVGIVLPALDFKLYGEYIHVGAVLMILAGTLSSEQSTSIGMLAGFAKAFESGIIIESSMGLDSINATQTIVYDRFDGMEVTDEEFELFNKLSHMGRTLVVFNDGPVPLTCQEGEQYKIYNDLSVEEKIDVMDSLIGPIVYIGDSSKDIALLQKSYVGISRGGMADARVVENSDIVLIDSQLNKVYETFLIARKIRTQAIMNNMIMFIMKFVVLIAAISFKALPLWFVVIADILTSFVVLRRSTKVLE